MAGSAHGRQYWREWWTFPACGTWARYCQICGCLEPFASIKNDCCLQLHDTPCKVDDQIEIMSGNEGFLSSRLDQLQSGLDSHVTLHLCRHDGHITLAEVLYSMLWLQMMLHSFHLSRVELDSLQATNVGNHGMDSFTRERSSSSAMVFI